MRAEGAYSLAVKDLLGVRGVSWVSGKFRMRLVPPFLIVLCMSALQAVGDRSISYLAAGAHHIQNQKLGKVDFAVDMLTTIARVCALLLFCSQKSM